MRIIELLIVCVVAFGGSILASTYYFLHPNSPNTVPGAMRWTNNVLHEASTLALVWYLLSRRAKSFSDLGFSFKLRDLPTAVILGLGFHLAFREAFNLLHQLNFFHVDEATAVRQVGDRLFDGTKSATLFFFQFLNPFYEELIVRAYLMTEVFELTGSRTKAVILSTVLQTSYHSYQGGPMAIASGTGFLLLSLFYAKTNRILPVILVHLYSDVGGTLRYFWR